MWAFGFWPIGMTTRTVQMETRSVPHSPLDLFLLDRVVRNYNPTVLTICSSWFINLCGEDHSTAVLFQYFCKDYKQ